MSEIILTLLEIPETCHHAFEASLVNLEGSRLIYQSHTVKKNKKEGNLGKPG